MRAALTACLLAAAGGAGAATQALVMAIGNYPQREARLKGAPEDARLGAAIARQLGAAPSRALRDEQLPLDDMRQVLNDFKRRLRPGDTAVIYFSGHGVRTGKHTGPGCREGLVAFDNRVYFDTLLRDDLDAIAETAGRVILFNDSCHAGGAITKQFELPWPGDGDDGYQIKSLPLPIEASATADCSRPSNLTPKQLSPQALAARIIYLAAARADEVAFSTPQGSLASQGWAACLADPGADRDRDGYVTASELTTCAQEWIARRHPSHRQNLMTVMGSDERLMKTPAR